MVMILQGLNPLDFTFHPGGLPINLASLCLQLENISCLELRVVWLGLSSLQSLIGVPYSRNQYHMPKTVFRKFLKALIFSSTSAVVHKGVLEGPFQVVFHRKQYLYRYQIPIPEENIGIGIGIGMTKILISVSVSV